MKELAGMDRTEDSIKQRQRAWLGAYRVSGSVRTVCEQTGVPRSTVKSWDHRDLYGFKVVYREAKEDFADYIEEIAIQRVEQQKPGDNPVLLLAMLHALKPDKYRRNSDRGDTGIGQEIMGEFKKYVKETQKAEREAEKKRNRSRDDRTDSEVDHDEAVEEAQRILASKRGDESREDGDPDGGGR